LIIDAGSKPRYLHAEVTVLSVPGQPDPGRLIGADRPPIPLSGRRPVVGPQRWELDLPGDQSVPVRYSVTVRASEKALVSGTRPLDLDSATLQHAVLGRKPAISRP